MASKLRKDPAVDLSAPWFGRNLRKQTAPALRGHEFSDKRTLRKIMYDENGEDVRILTPGVNWKVLSELRASYREKYEVAVREVFDNLVTTVLGTQGEDGESVNDAHQNKRCTRSRGRKPQVKSTTTNTKIATHNIPPSSDTAENGGMPKTRVTRSKVSKPQKSDADVEVTVSGMHPIVDVTNTEYRRSTRARTRKEAIPVDDSDDQNNKPSDPPGSEKATSINEVSISTNQELESSQGEEIEPQTTKRATRARKQKSNSGRKSEVCKADKDEHVTTNENPCETSQNVDCLQSTAARRSTRARTKRQQDQSASDITTASSVRSEAVPTAPSTARVTRSRTYIDKPPVVSELDLGPTDTTSQRMSHSRMRKVAPELEVSASAHQQALNKSEQAKVATSSEADPSKPSGEAKDNCDDIPDPATVVRSTVPSEASVQQVLDNLKPITLSEPPSSKPDTQEPQLPPESIESSGVRNKQSPCHRLSTSSADYSHVADTEDEVEPSKRTLRSKRLPLKLKKKRKRKVATKGKKVEDESETKTLEVVDSVEEEKREGTEEQLTSGDHVDPPDTGCSEHPQVSPDHSEPPLEQETEERMTPANSAESLYESCVEEMQTSTCTSAANATPTIVPDISRTVTKVSRIPPPSTTPPLVPGFPIQQTCTKSRPALPTAILAPETYTKKGAAPSPSVSTPQAHSKLRSPFSPRIPILQTYKKTQVAPSPCVPAPQTCTKPKPVLSPTSVPYLTGTPKVIKKLQEEHSTQNKSNIVSLSELLASKGRTPQSPQVGTTVTKKARNSPATTEPTSIPVPVTRTALSGTKRLRSVSLEKLPASLTAKRPSRTPTQDSTPVEHPPTLRTGGNEDSSPGTDGGGMDAQDTFLTPNTPALPPSFAPTTPVSPLRGMESATESSSSSCEKTDQSDTTPDSVANDADSEQTPPSPSQLTQPPPSPSQLRQPEQSSTNKFTIPEAVHAKDNRTTTKTKPSLWSILEKGDVSKLTFPAASSDLPLSFLPRTPPKKPNNFEMRHQKRVERVQRKNEEEERRKKELEAKKQYELQEKIRKRKEREKRVAEKVAKQREEAEKRRHAQGQTVHEEQLEKLSQKKEKEKEERNRKNKERTLAAEAKRKQEEERKKFHFQQMLEERRMQEELARQRLEQEEEERRQKRLEKSKMERERQLQREKEQEEAAMMRRQQEEEERQKAERLKRHQEEQRRLQNQARKEEEKRRFEQLLTSGTTLVKPPVPTPSASSNANRFIQQWKQLKTQAGDFFSSVSKTKPPNKTLSGYNSTSKSTQQVSPPQEAVHQTLNGTFTKNTSPEELKYGTKTQPSATPVQSSNMAQKYVPVSSYQMTPIQDDLLYENYDIEGLRSDDSTDDDECPRKQIPPWAQPQFLNTWVQNQEEEVRRNMIDVTQVFPPEELLREPDLARIFRKKRKRFFDRTSSAHWTSPMLKKSRSENL